MTTELLPCPFCGLEDIKISECNMTCSYCGARGGEAYKDEQKIQFWNERADLKSSEYKRGYMAAQARMVKIINDELWEGIEHENF